MRNPTIVVVTDRTDLDSQLFGTFAAAQDLLHQVPEQASSRDDLRERLAGRESGGIVFTTVQKFSLLDSEAAHPVLSKRSNIVVISDEAHRSQYGTKGRLDTKTGLYVYGYAKHMRDAIPNATFIGFTGTPVAKEDRDTRAVFGEYVSIYDIQDAVEDGATVPIYYESRLAKLDINQAEIEMLAGVAHLDTAVEAIRGKVETLVVTRGEQGALATRGSERAEVKAEPVSEVVDTTGAGDLFAAGFLLGEARGLGLERSLRLGAIAAAEVIQHYGARPEADLRALAGELLA